MSKPNDTRSVKHAPITLPVVTLLLVCCLVFGKSRDEVYWAPLTLGCAVLLGVLCYALWSRLRRSQQQAEALAVKMSAVQEAEQRFRLLVEGVAEYAIFMLGPDGQVASWNAGTERLKGYTADEIIGRHFACFYPPEDIADGKPEMDLRMAMAEGRFEDEGWRVRKDGSRYWCNVVITALRNEGGELIGFSKACRDLSDRREMEQKLAQANRLQQAILDSTPFAIIATDADGVIRRVNPAAERMLSHDADDMAGKMRFAALFEPADVAARAAELSQEAGARVAPGFEVFAYHARQGITDEREWNLMRGDGSSLAAQVSVTALRDGAGTINGFLGIAYDITERKRRDEYTRHIAHHDAVTGLPNRVLLQDRLLMAMQRSRRDGSRVGVLMIDLDHFKRINDSLGHHVGDAMLAKISERLGNCVRGGDTVARMGGDEFVVLLPDVTDEASIKRIAGAIVERVSAPMIVGSHELHVTPSVGVSVFPNDGQDVHTLLRHADMAMYQAKASGRRCFRVFSSAMERAAAEKLELEAAMRRALEREQFIIHYQPQVSLGSGRVVGMEALLRWEDPVRGAVPPSRFIPVAEETGLIVPLGEWVLRKACRDAVRLQQHAGVPLRLAVNLSPRQFRQTNLQAVIEKALADSGLDPAHLELEITEGVLMDSSDELAERLQRLRGLGLAIGVDDFGTGYSSLSYITRFPIDTLKIDRSFVSRLPDSAGDAAVAQTIIALAHSLRIKVVAEGVETEQQLEFLRARQCDMGQGFRFGKGGTVDDICAQNFQYGDDAPWLSQIGTAVDVGLQRLRAANS
jgi:diguanylate cyclase (GGDEF)-like protein/PAS domain S-box-containing protein